MSFATHLADESYKNDRWIIIKNNEVNKPNKIVFLLLKQGEETKLDTEGYYDSLILTTEDHKLYKIDIIENKQNNNNQETSHHNIKCMVCNSRSIRDYTRELPNRINSHNKS